MSEHGKAVVRRFFEEIYAGGDLDLIPQVFAADYVEYDPASDGEIAGHGGVRRDLEPHVTAFADRDVEIERQIADGDLIATRVTVRGTHVGELMGVRATGTRVAVTGTVIHRVAGGRLREGWWNWDTLGLLRQLGAVRA